MNALINANLRDALLEDLRELQALNQGFNTTVIITAGFQVGTTVSFTLIASLSQKTSEDKDWAVNYIKTSSKQQLVVRQE